MMKKKYLLLVILAVSMFLFCGCMQEEAPDITENNQNGIEAQTLLNQDIGESEDVVKSQIDTILSDYFQYREASIFKAHEAKDSTAPVPLEKTFDYNFLSTDIIELEQSRANGIRDYLNTCELILINSETIFDIREYNIEQDSIHVYVYEAISMELMSESSEEPFESALGLEHEIYIDPISMTITVDEYDEEIFSGIVTDIKDSSGNSHYDSIAERVKGLILSGDWDALAQMSDDGYIETINDDGSETLTPSFKLEKEIASIEYKYKNNKGYFYYVEYKDGTTEVFSVGIYEEQEQTKIIILY